MPLSKEAINHAQLCLTAFAESIPDAEQATARDWAGFFAGLATLLSQLLPIILPLFAEPKPTE